MTDDELDDLLTPIEAPANVALRERLFARTWARQRRNRYLRRISMMLGIAAIVHAGGAVGWYGKPTPAPVIEREIEKVFVPVPTEPKVSRDDLVMTPEQLELEAEKARDPAECASLYKQAGDAFLRVRRVEAAMRCYRQHLSEGGVATIRSEDSWMLMNLKQSQKENDHAKVD